MIAGLSKAITLYLAPVIALTATILSLLAFLAPTLLLHDQVALLTVTPSSVLQRGSTESVDGPSVFMGALGSCARPNNAAGINCTESSVSPQYDLSLLPSNAPILLLSPPAATTPVFIAVALSFSALFLFSFTLISFRHKMPGKLSMLLEKPALQRLSAWMGFFGFMIGLTSFLVVRMWFGKAIQDFNASIQSQGEKGPKLIASSGNAFTMIWVAYAFYAVPIIISLAKLNVTASK
ncbi:hypothetical protein BDQ12DRAFT_710948 [Crucibulum laeve]|uniref:Actin cortical patch SUR7/pH-response regulator pali n=1 Tax=Crucibulum laeve TaxID=68775 RepID=A0A5C3M6Q0_9AGAR|nr:hypothetical protein BDQ12DRAFT_710948 [Crucibulum laeve]